MGSKESETDVLIIGSGPAGLVLALDLALQLQDVNKPSFSFRIVDSSLTQTPLNQSHAVLIHARVLEYLSRHAYNSKISIADELVSRGQLAENLRINVERDEVFKCSLKGIAGDDTAFATPLWLSQSHIEHVLESSLKSTYDRAVDRGITALHVEQNGDSATAWLTTEPASEKKGLTATEIVHAKYIIGADGAHSVVRRTAKISFSGDRYTQDFILLDGQLSSNTPLGNDFHIFIANYGFAGAFPLKGGKYRIFGSIPKNEGLVGEPTVEDFNDLLGHVSQDDIRIKGEPTWITQFKLHHQLADRYREGRIFIAGDAAHIHSPIGGGMSTGIQDSVNLGWKLATALRSPGMCEELLDSYNTERYPVGETLLRSTDKSFEFMCVSNPILRWIIVAFLPFVLPMALRNEERRKKTFKWVCGLDQKYESSPFIGRNGGVRVSDSLLRLQDNSVITLHKLLKRAAWHLLLFSGTNASAYEALKTQLSNLDENEDWKTYNILSPSTLHHKTIGENQVIDENDILHARYRFSENSGFILVRPDGYIAFQGVLGEVGDMRRWWNGEGFEETSEPGPLNRGLMVLRLYALYFIRVVVNLARFFMGKEFANLEITRLPH